ncbi:MAG: glycosyltransferase [Gemmatimonadales bacterium]
MSAPSVSVIVIFLNAERFMREAIESVVAQHSGDWELLLVDDGSTDGSTALAHEYLERLPGKVRYLEHPEHRNRGMSASRNLGLRHARGRLIAFLDADDVWLPNKLTRQVALLDAHPEAAMVYGATQYWHGWTGRDEDLARDHVPSLGIPGDTLYHPPTLSTLLYPLGQGTAPCPSDIMFRRSLVDEIGGFEEAFGGGNQLYEDQAFLAKVYLRAKVFVSSETWDKYRIHPDSCSSEVERLGRYRPVRRFFLSWLDRYLTTAGITDPAIHMAVRRARMTDESPWSLRAVEGGGARLEFPSGEPGSLRVAIERPTARDYDIQLNLPRLRLQSGHRYAIGFAARADQPREASVGVAQGHEPWDGLGWYQRIELTPQWRRFEGEFVAPADEVNARIHFDVGDHPASVEVTSVELRHLPDGDLVEPTHPGSGTTSLFGELRRLSPLSRQWGLDRGTPIDRHYIEAFLAGEAAAIRGRVLEIEDDHYTRRFGGGRVTRSDVLHVEEGNPKATVVADLTSADQIPSDSFDCVVLTQTLHLIYDTRAALETLHRILKPGGALLATFPGLSPVSQKEWPGSWYWGFTSASSRRLFEETFGPGQVSVEAFGNVLTAIGFLHGVACEELRDDELEHRDPDYELLIAVRATKAGSPR